MAKRTASTVEPMVEMPEGVTEETPFTKFFDHQKKAVSELGKAFTSLLPEGMREHGEAALKEMVEGYRNFFNSALDELIQTIEKAKLEEKVVETMEKAKIGSEKVSPN